MKMHGYSRYVQQVNIQWYLSLTGELYMQYLCLHIQCTSNRDRDHDLLRNTSLSVFSEVVKKVQTKSPHHVDLLGVATGFLLYALRQLYERAGDEREGVKRDILHKIEDTIANWVMVGGSSSRLAKAKDEIKVFLSLHAIEMSCSCVTK